MILLIKIQRRVNWKYSIFFEYSFEYIEIICTRQIQCNESLQSWTKISGENGNEYIYSSSFIDHSPPPISILNLQVFHLNLTLNSAMVGGGGCHLRYNCQFSPLSKIVDVVVEQNS